jgi:hypothetical protein
MREATYQAAGGFGKELHFVLFVIWVDMILGCISSVQILALKQNLYS